MGIVNRSQAACLAAFAILVISLIAGCAASNSMSGIPDKGLALEYRFPKGQMLTYNMSHSFAQDMEVMGRNVKLSADERNIFSVSSSGRSEDNIKLNVILDSMSFKLVSPRGALIPDMSSVIGKSFEMTLTPQGVESELSQAEAIKYEMAPGEERSIASTFQAIFPDLPSKPVKVGDTWTFVDTVTDNSSKGTLQMVFVNVCRLEGLETVDGFECAKILNEVTGIISGTSIEQGTELLSSGEIKATETWYFAHKHSIFVKSVSTGSGEGLIKGTGAQKIEIPTKREFKIVINLTGQQEIASLWD